MVVIGNGMVSAKLCQLLVERNLSKHVEVVVIGAEAVMARLIWLGWVCYIGV